MLRDLKKGDDVCFISRRDGTTPDKRILGTFSHFTQKGNAIVYIFRNGMRIKKPVEYEDLREVHGDSSGLSLVDLRPPTVMVSQPPGEDSP